MADDGVLLLRADVSSRIGTGHVMRCLALAQAWQDKGGHAIFALAGTPHPIEARLTDEKMRVERVATEPGSTDDACATAAFARDRGAQWIVLDGYHFDASYQRCIKNAGLRLLVLDDYSHTEHYSADLVLNQNLHARPELYARRDPSTQLLLGPRYALLRREFTRWCGWRRSIPEIATKVLVTLGGTDADNVTLKVVEALQGVQVPGVQARVVIGAGSPHWLHVKAAAGASRTPIELLGNVADMPRLWAWADIAIGAGGSSCWERAFFGLPSIVIILADNQVDLATSCAAAGIAKNLGWHDRLSAAQIQSALVELLTRYDACAAMARRGPEFVDGRGAERVASSLASH